MICGVILHFHLPMERKQNIFERTKSYLLLIPSSSDGTYHLIRSLWSLGYDQQSLKKYKISNFRMFLGGFRESTQSVIPIEETDFDTFRLLLYFIYSNGNLKKMIQSREMTMASSSYGGTHWFQKHSLIQIMNFFNWCCLLFSGESNSFAFDYCS
jgi:hypothetical protein